MCMWFGCNPCINFCHFFLFANLVIFWPQILWKCCDSGYRVSATPHTILYWSFWNFAHVFPMVWRCACGLNIILELIFVTFSTLRTLSFSDLRFYESVETVGTLWAQQLIQFYTDLYETLYMFLPWSGDCMWFGYNPWINFCHFFPPCELCHFQTSDSMKVYRQWLPCKTQLLIQFHAYLYATLHIFFSTVWRCACGLDLILQLIFVTFPLC